MSNANLKVVEQNQDINLWDDQDTLTTIKNLFAANLTNHEFVCFVEMGKRTGLNPFLREIWAVKYNKSTANIFIGRDGYRKSAQAHPDYEYHQPVAVYSNDDFKIVNDKIEHVSNIFDGHLVGAYCKVKRKSSENYTYVAVKLSEYHLKQGLWHTKPETMIKKVAEAQALRAAFQEIFAGTYSDAEMPHDSIEPPRKIVDIAPDATQTEKLKALLVPSNDTREKLEQEINRTLLELQFDEERTVKMLEHYNAKSIKELNEERLKDCLEQLNKAKSRNIKTEASNG